MKKLAIVTLLLLLNLAVISALDIEAQGTEISNILIKELNESAVYKLKITNNDLTSTEFKIFSYVGVEINPEEFRIPYEVTNEIMITATPSRKVMEENEGWFSFEYRIAGKQPGTYRNSLRLKIVSLSELLEFQPLIILPDDETATLVIKNKEEREIKDISLQLESRFFEYSETISLNPQEQIELEIPITKDIRDLEADDYNYQISLSYLGAESLTEAEINYLEKDGIISAQATSGIISRTTITEKTNAGNVPTIATITQTKNVLTRLFTTHSEIPQTTERSGLLVEYTWSRSLKPNESIRITTTTNYTIPLLIIILVILVIVVAKFYIRSNLILKKRISFVKTKGGEFALKVRIKARARKRLEDIKITDRIPGMTKIHEKFGTKPDKIDEKSRTVHWNISRLNAGEERTFSYLIYSKIKVVGTFELPVATASYKFNNTPYVTQSNKTSFAAEGS
ncbi:hypothetical protein COU62_00955 [Candidatus Pacearchaeota archaeon CG10_big_fil_rev_8_21_14_0_10_35_219]|nr:hypothetical protein [Candidatus Pacearchaeota archaeon]OIO43008.1 MAG: hypothetical protein AUJ63_01125 [Candidatus Pacearchaeota archaeon CG1_02_35_32]PIO08134.1 MAG: hypothetical protein COU62_00955 [Candidatus Pacearchaeota archaeon CG10_big_fil_rev_8_21_14_0_10_35_219]PJA70222.1 MAG: hypothetical protein CO155_01105 [Candidatus Pacearchaeota archaeon CG_4_9_14_3_um_filter_35_19]PJB93697.1 MAG: hypothetical protein CO081_04870 [Candidatus Pacearchaeota archaeon CG_4_9_14_0_8_um_filter_35